MATARKRTNAVELKPVEFLIADTFIDSLARLTGDEQKAAKTTAFDLQVNPSSPGMQFHKVERAKDRSFWSVRVSGDVRLIVHKADASLLLCYVDHHDAAYRWAEQRRLERHPKTGAAQLVEVRETVREIEVPRYVETKAPSAPIPSRTTLFDSISDEDLLSYGIPPGWLGAVRCATEDTLFDLAGHLPGEASEALLELATGGTPQRSVKASESADAFGHPDAQRRFRVLANAEDLQRALDFPWDRWTVFLHPAQQEVVDRRYSGAARVSGSAGTGKTIVALHRAAHLARAYPKAKVLLTTFSDPLARALSTNLGKLIGSEPGVLGRIVVSAIDRVGIEMYEKAFGPATLANGPTIRSLLAAASQTGEAHRFTERFLESEWRNVVDEWQLVTWEGYRDVVRLGRKTRLGEQQRALLWSIFQRVRSGLTDQGLVTVPGALAQATQHLANGGGHRPFDFVVVDEAQDVGVPQLRFIATLVGDHADGLFFTGDLGQRIFQTPFSWRSLGVDVRGRSSTLRINYRTSHQIRRQADRLLSTELTDVDGNTEVRKGTVSAFNGPEPVVRILKSVEAETAAIVEWLMARTGEGFAPHEIGVFVRSETELKRASAGVLAAGLDGALLDAQSGDAIAGRVAVSTMHLAKGLEFRAVAVVACDDEILPLQSRIENVTDDADLADIYETERHLLYVACTRARDCLLVTGVEPASEFLDDLCGDATRPAV